MELKLNDLYVDYIGKIDSKYEHANMIQFNSKELIELGDKLGLQFHYELHFNKKSAFVRFDCHCKDYHDYKNQNKKEYIDNVGEKRLKYREALKNEFKSIFPEYKFKKYYYNYLGLIKKDLDISLYLHKQVEVFFEETYLKIIDILKNL